MEPGFGRVVGAGARPKTDRLEASRAIRGPPLFRWLLDRWDLRFCSAGPGRSRPQPLSPMEFHFLTDRGHKRRGWWSRARGTGDQAPRWSPRLCHPHSHQTATPHFCIRAGGTGSSQETAGCLEAALPPRPAFCHVRLIGGLGPTRSQLRGSWAVGWPGRKSTWGVERGAGGASTQAGRAGA